MAAGGGLALIPLLAGCAPTWMVVSDLHADRWFVTDVASGDIAVTFDLDVVFPDQCRASDGNGGFCLTYGSRHRVDADGHDEVAFTFTPAGLPDDADFSDPANNGQLVGVRLTDPPTVTWAVDRLDWSGADPDGRVCRRDPTDPCRPAPDATPDEQRACALFWPHDLVVLGEDAEALQVLVADTRNRRVLWLEAPRTDSCARVTEILNTANPDWDIYTSVNALDPWQEGDTRHLLLSIKDTLGEDAQQPGDGHGKIVSFTDAGEGWRQDWEFPPASTTEASFVNAPHGVSHDDAHVYFAHSLGRSDLANEGSGGSLGVLDRDGRYLFDGVFTFRSLLFPRDTTPLPDGRLVLVDSGAKGSETAPAETALYVVDLPADTDPADVDGVWTPDHARQDFRPLRLRHAPAYPDAWVLFSAETVTAGDDLAVRLR